jgi:dCMP deaminase
MERPSWHETWISVAHEIAKRSYDSHLKVGAIIVSEDNTRMLSVGYNGNYKGGPHERESDEPGMGGFLHAEENALVKCDYNFSKRKHMYITHSPCRRCAKLIVNAGISQVIYDSTYRETSGIEILKSVGIEVFSMREVIIRHKVL